LRAPAEAAEVFAAIAPYPIAIRGDDRYPASHHGQLRRRGFRMCRLQRRLTISGSMRTVMRGKHLLPGEGSYNLMGV